MKKSILYAAAGLTLLLSQACKKSSTESLTTNRETVSVTMSTNDTYKYTLPVSGPTPYVIQSASAKAAVTTITNDNSSSTFIYTPAQSGSDSVTVSNQPPQHGPCTHQGCNHPPKGNCSGNTSQTQHTITFKFVVKGVST